VTGLQPYVTRFHWEKKQARPAWLRPLLGVELHFRTAKTQTPRLSRARTRRVHLFRACLDGLGWGAIGEPLPKPATFKVAGSTVSLTT